ncbi:hypothetical protein GN244_ATG10332 [Phytophthora infestans]|uniref:Uncharacterized protein n=1 Tax=Phytophthora infestans TaxID=4787 RepID=A0A833SRB2_PHYIN|nr:hypothetical protein GN244_ATG10332 [Phytophthora infestans]KAF4140866.1 hypothetical protein GN958_ATG09714 [Phytophthora infestans]
MSTANVTRKWRISETHAELPIKNHKYVKNSTDMYMVNKRIDKIANFDAFVNLEVLWINDNPIQELDGLSGCFCLKHSTTTTTASGGPGDMEVQDVLDWLKIDIGRDIKLMEKWLDSSRNERKEIESVNDKGKEISWDEDPVDPLDRIPALKEIQNKMNRQNGSSSNHKGGNNEAKLADAVHPLLKDTSVTVHSAASEDAVVNATPAEEVKAEKEEEAAASTEEEL